MSREESLTERLLVSLRAARERFMVAAGQAQNPAFHRAFRLFALQRERLMLQLKPSAATRDASLAEHVTSRLTHDAALATRGPASGGDKALVFECTAAEDGTIAAFEAALADPLISARVRDQVIAQIRELLASRDQIIEWKRRLETTR
jgi:hypothetical protein